jgi:nucleotidyltransferase substrate binding protein (TIGR01987 family)
MNSKKDIRWQQRFSNYRKALTQLKEVVELKHPNKFEEQGLVQAFEFTYELAWNTLKDFLEYQGISEVVGSRDAFRKAFSAGLVSDGAVWMRMIESRNRTTHTYNESTAREIADDVRNAFIIAFCELEQTLEHRLES